MSDLLLWDDSSIIGKISIEAAHEDLVLGQFSKHPSFDKYARIFEIYEEAAGNQELLEIDRLDKVIASYGFRVTKMDGSSLRFIRDLQVTASGVSFRWQ